MNINNGSDALECQAFPATDIRDQFLRALQESQTPFTIFLISGIKLQCSCLFDWDDTCMLVPNPRGVAGQQHRQIVQFSAISTIG